MKMICHTLAFNYLPIINDGIKQAQMTMASKHQWLLVDCGFPHTASEDLKKLANKYGLIYVKMPKNLGVAGNWRWVQNLVGLDDSEILMGIDPDSRIQNYNWDVKLIEAFEKQQDAAYICMDVDGLKNRERKIVCNGLLYEYSGLTAWTVGAFAGRFLNKVKLDQFKPHYGYIEHDSSRKMEALGMKWYALKDYFDEHVSVPGELLEWKQAQVRGSTTLEFREWREKK